MNADVFKERITELENGILEVSGLPNGNYDDKALGYDKLINSKLYNNIMWGNSPSDYASFLANNLNGTKNQTIADIGCGTLSFSAEVYAKATPSDIYLCDLSMEMLKLGKKRLQLLRNDISGFHFLRSDALNMPFKDHSIKQVFCLGILHLFEHKSGLLTELKRILKPGGELYITSLCTNRKFSAQYLKFLYKKGLVSSPMNSDAIIGIIVDNGFNIKQTLVKGGMAYITATTEI